MTNNRPIINKEKDKEEFDSSFSDRARDISLMVKDLLVYPDYLKVDAMVIRKMRILNYALGEFEDFCNRTMLSNSNKK
jgi:hypothetical protein